MINTGNPEASNPPPPQPPEEPQINTSVFVGGGGGDVHYGIAGPEPAAIPGIGMVASNFVADENSTEYGNHWAVEWIEVENNFNINAILSFRTIFGMWPGTTINTRVVTIGAPRVVTTEVRQDDDSPALENGFTINPAAGLPLIFFGGIFYDFLNTVGGTRTSVGPNMSFSPTDNWRLLGIGEGATTSDLTSALRQKFNIPQVF